MKVLVKNKRSVLKFDKKEDILGMRPAVCSVDKPAVLQIKLHVDLICFKTASRAISFETAAYEIQKDLQKLVTVTREHLSKRHSKADLYDCLSQVTLPCTHDLWQLVASIFKTCLVLFGVTGLREPIQLLLDEGGVHRGQVTSWLQGHTITQCRVTN